MKTSRAAAQVLGNVAFKNGLKCAPCLDKDLMKMIEGRRGEKIGASLPLLNGWLDGWTQANLYGGK